MNVRNIQYKNSKFPKGALRQSENQNYFLEQQNYIFDQLKSADDPNDIYMYLSILSETITNHCKDLNKNFKSDWFIKLIRSSLTLKNPVLTEICIIIINKLFLVYSLKSLEFFSNKIWIDMYFLLLSAFHKKYSIIKENSDMHIEGSIAEENDSLNGEGTYVETNDDLDGSIEKDNFDESIRSDDGDSHDHHVVLKENDNDSIVSLKIEIMRLISLISTDEDLIIHCVTYSNQIIRLLNETNNDTLTMFYSGFILNVLKYINKNVNNETDKVPIEVNLTVDTIINLIESENFKIKLIGMEIFTQFLSIYKTKEEFESISEIIPIFIDFLDFDSFELVSLSIRIFEKLYSININFEENDFHQIVLDKITHLLLHPFSTVRYSAVQCISSFISNHKDNFNSMDELIHNLLSNGEKGSFDLQIKVSYILANIIMKYCENLISEMPIQRILSLFCHIFTYYF